MPVAEACVQSEDPTCLALSVIEYVPASNVFEVCAKTILGEVVDGILIRLAVALVGETMS